MRPCIFLRASADGLFAPPGARVPARPDPAPPQAATRPTRPRGAPAQYHPPFRNGRTSQMHPADAALRPARLAVTVAAAALILSAASAQPTAGVKDRGEPALPSLDEIFVARVHGANAGCRDHQ